MLQTRLLVSVFFSFGILGAQTKFPVTVSVGNYSQLGYKFPDIAITVGTEVHKPAYWAYAKIELDPTDKSVYGNVIQIGVSGRVYHKPGKGFFFGGGGDLRNIRFHDFGSSYWTGGPIASGGWSDGKLRLTVDGVFARHDIRYDLRGVSWVILYDFVNKLRVGMEQGVYSLRSKINGQDFGNNLTSGFLVGYVF